MTEKNSVLPDSSPSYKNFQDAIDESTKLIRILSDIILECATCSSKLKSQLNANAGVPSPGQRNTMDTTTIATG
jgi:hypothetical protein